jgi:enoyl-CoA hydratase/carnithine racemase
VFEDLRFETMICDSPRPRIARITLNRPQAMNAYTFAMCGQLQAAIAAFRDDDDLMVLILSGAGNRAFAPAAISAARTRRIATRSQPRRWAAAAKCATACKRSCWR